MGLKLSRFPGQGIVIGDRQVELKVELLQEGHVLIDVSGTARMINLGGSIALANGSIRIRLDKMDDRAHFDFTQKGDKVDWLPIELAERYDRKLCQGR